MEHKLAKVEDVAGNEFDFVIIGLSNACLLSIHAVLIDINRWRRKPSFSFTKVVTNSYFLRRQVVCWLED